MICHYPKELFFTTQLICSTLDMTVIYFNDKFNNNKIKIICPIKWKGYERLSVTDKIWMKRAKSFSEAQEQDIDYYLKMSPQERLETVQFLREQYPKFARVKLNESRKRLRRTVRIVQQA